MSEGIVWVFSKPGDGPMGTYRWFDGMNPPSELYPRIFAEENGLTGESMTVEEFCRRNKIAVFK